MITYVFLVATIYVLVTHVLIIIVYYFVVVVIFVVVTVILFFLVLYKSNYNFKKLKNKLKKFNIINSPLSFQNLF